MDGGEISEDDKVEYNEIKEKEPDVRDSYWAYPDPDIIFEDFKTNQPLCLICTKDGVYGAMLRTGIMVEFDFDTKKLWLQSEMLSFLIGGLVVMLKHQINKAFLSRVFCYHFN
jgi:hypothetical protein